MGLSPFGYASINLFDNNTLIADAYTHFEFFDADTFQKKTVMEDPPYGLMTQLEDGWCVVTKRIINGPETLYLYEIVPTGKRLLTKYTYFSLFFINAKGDYIINDRTAKTICGFTSLGQWVIKYSDLGKEEFINPNVYVFGERAILTAESRTIIIDTIKGSILLVVESRCCQILKIIKGITFFNKLAVELGSAKVLFQYDYYPSVLKVNENTIYSIFYTGNGVTSEINFESRDYSGRILEKCKIGTFRPGMSNPHFMGFIGNYVYSFSRLYWSNSRYSTPCFTIQNIFDPSDKYDFIISGPELAGFNAHDNGKDLFIWCEGWIARFDIKNKAILNVKNLERSCDIFDEKSVGQVEIDGFLRSRKLALYELRQPSNKVYYNYLGDKPNFVVPLNNGYYIFPNFIGDKTNWPTFYIAGETQRKLEKQDFKSRMLWVNEYKGKPICLLQEGIDMRLLVLEENKMKEMMHWYVMKNDQPSLFLIKNNLLFFCIGSTHYLTDMETLKSETINHYQEKYRPEAAKFIKDYIITSDTIKMCVIIDTQKKKAESRTIELKAFDNDIAIFRENNDMLVFDGIEYNVIEDFFKSKFDFTNWSCFQKLIVASELIYDDNFNKIQYFPIHSAHWYFYLPIDSSEEGARIGLLPLNYDNRQKQNKLYSIIDVSKANSFSVTKTESKLDETYHLELTLEDGQSLSGKAYLTKSSSSNWLDSNAKSIDFAIDKQGVKVSIEFDKEYDQVIFDCNGLLDVEKSKLEDGQEHPMFEGSSTDYRTQRALTITRWKN